MEMNMKLIAAVDRAWGIGYRGELLCRVKGDLLHFKAVTSGHTVILGRKTLSTFPGGRPLKNRRNLVLSRSADFTVEGATVLHSAAEVLSALAGEEEAFVIGGESVYRLLLPYCDTAILTKFEGTFEADAFLPDLDASPDWELSEQGEERVAEAGDSHPGLRWSVCVYRRRA